MALRELFNAKADKAMHFVLGKDEGPSTVDMIRFTPISCKEVLALESNLMQRLTRRCTLCLSEGPFLSVSSFISSLS